MKSNPWHQLPTWPPSQEPQGLFQNRAPHPPPKVSGGLPRPPMEIPLASQVSKAMNDVFGPETFLRRARPQISRAARTQRHPCLSIIHDL